MERLPFVLRFGQETAQKPLSDAERETLLQTLAAALMYKSTGLGKRNFL